MITQALCTSFLLEMGEAIHNFTAGTGDTFKLALFCDTASIVGTFDAATTNYSSMGVDQVVGTNYTAGGAALTSITPAISGTKVLFDFSDLVFANVTLVSRGAMIYNSSKANRAVCILDFGVDKTYTAAAMTIQFPAPDALNAIMRMTSTT